LSRMLTQKKFFTQNLSVLKIKKTNLNNFIKTIRILTASIVLLSARMRVRILKTRPE